MSSAGNKSSYCPSCKRTVTIALCESSHPHCSLCNLILCTCECHSHNPIPKTTTKETETNKADEGTSKSTKKKSPTSKNNVKENDKQTSGAQVNTSATVRSQENPTPQPQVYHISLESVLESFGLLCTHGHDGASTSSSGRGSEDDYAFTVVWEYDPNLGQRGSNNSKSQK